MEQIFWCATDDCKNAACVITIANTAYCSEGHLMIPIGFIEDGVMVSKDIAMPRQVG
tara:strand:+ start:617 stop:787 length:171 start_codon:yes stop_codon:yes gene_type:complete